MIFFRTFFYFFSLGMVVLCSFLGMIFFKESTSQLIGGFSVVLGFIVSGCIFHSSTRISDCLSSGLFPKFSDLFNFVEKYRIYKLLCEQYQYSKNSWEILEKKDDYDSYVLGGENISETLQRTINVNNDLLKIRIKACYSSCHLPFFPKGWEYTVKELKLGISFEELKAVMK